jgi:hypothetical protein
MDTFELINTLLHVLFAVFGEGSTIVSRVVSAIALLVTLTGSASYIVKGLEYITNLTPTDKDNRALDKIKRGLAWLIALLDYIAANPDKSKARDK